MAKSPEANLEVVGEADEISRELREVLQDLQKNLRGVLGSVIVDNKGAPLVWELRGGAEPMRVATAAAMLAKAADRTSGLLDMAGVRNTAITAEHGTIAVFRITEGSLLAVLLQPTANSVLVVVEVGKALERLREVIAPGR